MTAESDKSALRRDLRARRAALPAASAASASAAIVQHLSALHELARPAGPVLTYAAVGSEADPAGLTAVLRARGAAIALPRVRDAAAGRMDAAGWPGPAGPASSVDPSDRPDLSELAVGPLGVPAPGPGAPTLEPAVVLTPGVGFCPDTGARLGQGGGFYDRYLAARPRVLTIGVAFATQLDRRVARVAEPHDRAVDVLVTERGSARFDGR